MDDVVSRDQATARQPRKYARDWRKSMSDHVAYALLVYTGLQIFTTMGAMKATGMKLLALFALVVLVAAIIPACRWFEKRWSGLSDEQASSPDYAAAFKRDITGLWLMAIGLPFVLTLFFRGLAVLL